MSRWKEIGLYIIFGVLTTLVMIIVLEGLELLLLPRWGERSYLFSNVIAFIAALIFAFVVNKLYVFQQKSWEPRLVVREVATFTSARVASFALEFGLVTLFNELIWRMVNDWFTPLWYDFALAQWMPDGYLAVSAYRSIVRWGLIAPIVVVLNYVFAKWVVFATPRNKFRGDPDVSSESEENAI